MLIHKTIIHRKGNSVEKLILYAISGILSGLLILVLYNLTINGITTSQINSDLGIAKIIQKDLRDLCAPISSNLKFNPEEGLAPLVTEKVRFSNSLTELKLLNDPEGPHFNLTWKNQQARLSLEGCDFFDGIILISPTHREKIIGGVKYAIYRNAYYNETDQKAYVTVTFEEV